MIRAKTVRIANPARRRGRRNAPRPWASIYHARYGGSKGKRAKRSASYASYGRGMYTRTNPGKRKRRLTPAQIAAGFGGKRRQSSMLTGRRRRRNAGYFSVRKTKKRARRAGLDTSGINARNARRSKAASVWGRPSLSHRLRRRSKPRRRSNIASIVSIGLGNPARKRRRNRRTTMARARRRNYSRRRRPNTTHRRRRTRRNFSLAGMFGGTRTRRRRTRRAVNPFRSYHRRRRVGRRHYRRNPGGGGFFGRTSGMLMNGAYLVGGMVGTRALTQMVLQTRNTGWFGYAANFIAAIVGGGLIGKFVNKQAGTMFTLGGVGATVLRVVQENTPIGSYVSSQLAGYGDYGMGIYLPTTFFTPLTYGRDQATAQLPAAVSAMGAGRGVRGLSAGRYGRGRYN